MKPANFHDAGNITPHHESQLFQTPAPFRPPRGGFLVCSLRSMSNPMPNGFRRVYSLPSATSTLT